MKKNNKFFKQDEKIFKSRVVKIYMKLEDPKETFNVFKKYKNIKI